MLTSLQYDNYNLWNLRPLYSTPNCSPAESCSTSEIVHAVTFDIKCFDNCCLPILPKITSTSLESNGSMCMPRPKGMGGGLKRTSFRITNTNLPLSISADLHFWHFLHWVTLKGTSRARLQSFHICVTVKLCAITVNVACKWLLQRVKAIRAPKISGGGPVHATLWFHPSYLALALLDAVEINQLTNQSVINQSRISITQLYP